MLTFIKYPSLSHWVSQLSAYRTALCLLHPVIPWCWACITATHWARRRWYCLQILINYMLPCHCTCWAHVLAFRTDDSPNPPFCTTSMWTILLWQLLISVGIINRHLHYKRTNLFNSWRIKILNIWNANIPWDSGISYICSVQITSHFSWLQLEDIH